MSATVADFREMAKRAEALETMLGDISTCLAAIDIGDLLVSTGKDAAGCSRLSVGLSLVDLARRRALEFEALPGVELSVRLSRLASGDA